MHYHRLPADFFPNGTPAQAAVHVYQSENNALRNGVSVTSFLFSFLHEGTKEVMMGNQVLRLENDRFLAVAAGNCFMSEKTSIKGRFSSTLLFFDQQLMQDFRAAHSQQISRLLRQTSAVPREMLAFRHDAFTRAFVQGIGALKGASAEMLSLKVQEILLYLLENQPAALCSFFAENNRNADEIRFRSLIDAHIDSNLTVTELAFLSNLSISTFKRRFLKVYHDSPTNWLRQRRMERAAFLLRYNKERPSDIYLRFGYESLSSFSQSFKHAFGKSPKEYQMEQLT